MSKQDKKFSEIEQMKRSNPKNFWKYFKSKNNSANNITLEEFKTYFSNLYSDLQQPHNEEAKDFTYSHDFNLEYSSFPELNKNFICC